MTGKKQDTSKKREAILDGAVKAFCEEGYETTSMDRIAEFSSASKRTVYNHFPSKEALFHAVVKRFLCEASELKNIPYDPKKTIEKQLSNFADAKISMINDPAHLGLVRATIGVFIKNPEFGKITMENAQMGENYFLNWLEAAKKDGKLKFKDASFTAEIFWNMISGAFFWPQLFQGPLPSKTIKTQKAELIQVFLSRYGV